MIKLKRKTILKFFLVLILFVGTFGVALKPVAYSQSRECADGTPIPDDIVSADALDAFCRNAAAASDAQDLESDCNEADLNPDNCGILGYIATIVNVLSAIVGVVIVIMIVVGGIQYTSARDNPQAVAAARSRIVNAILALVFFLGVYAFLQWVVPGGVFSG